jgi:hypothetical protein
VSFSGFFHSAQRAPLSSRAATSSPARRAAFQTSRRTSSSASVASATMWKGSRHSSVLGQWVSHRAGDPRAHVCAHQDDGGATLLAEALEEAPQGGGVAPRSSPDQPAGVVVDDDDEVAPALAVADLIDAQAAETGEAVEPRVALGHHPGDDPPNGPPGDPHQLHDRGLADLGGQPGGLVIEGPGAAALDARCVGFQERHRAPQVERPPAPPILTSIEAGRPPLADPTPLSRAPTGVHRDDQSATLEHHALDHHPLNSEQSSPYPYRSHAVPASPGSQFQQPEILGDMSFPHWLRRPTERSGDPQFRGSITRPACAPVNASPPPLQAPTHDSGSSWVATPSM